MLKAAIAAVGLILVASPASADVLHFSATLNGNQAPTITGSLATGTASVEVDTVAQTISVVMDVSGISLDDLYDHVIHAGVGPVHLHLYAANGEISLLVPFPYGDAYSASASGFRLAIADLPYAENAARVGSTLTFQQFVQILGSDFVYLNVHTDAMHDGEISGRLVAAE